MAESSRYSCCFSTESVAFVIGLAKQKQRKVLDLAEGISSAPQSIGDYQMTDASGRTIENLLIEEFLFTYWIDHAVREVQIIEILKV
jgi:hypothetical protein